LWFEDDALTRWEGEAFPEQDLELSQRMRLSATCRGRKGRDGAKQKGPLC